MHPTQPVFRGLGQRFSAFLPVSAAVSRQQPATVNGAADTALLLSGQQIEEGTGSCWSAEG